MRALMTKKLSISKSKLFGEFLTGNQSQISKSLLNIMEHVKKKFIPPIDLTRKDDFSEKNFILKEKYFKK